MDDLGLKSVICAALGPQPFTLRIVIIEGPDLLQYLAVPSDLRLRV